MARENLGRTKPHMNMGAIGAAGSVSLPVVPSARAATRVEPARAPRCWSEVRE